MTEFKRYDVMFFKKGMLKEGDVVTILDEAAPTEGQYAHPCQCTIKMGNGNKLYLKINNTSRDLIVAKWGNESKNWIQKRLVYQGLAEMRNMMGHLFKPME